MSKKCPKCYALNNNDNQFCNKCGEPLILNQIPQNQNYQFQQNNNQIPYQPRKKTNSTGENIALIVVIIVIAIIVISSLSAFLLYLM